MKIVTSSRRQIVMAVLLSLAVLGAAMRHWADNPSVARDVGTLLLVMWLPAVGNLVGFVIRKFPRRGARDEGFAAGFTTHLTAEVTPIAAAMRGLDPAERRCTMLLGSEGFTVRSALPLSHWLTAGGAQTLDFELLRPAAGAGRLAPGTTFHVLAGTVAVASGRVTQSSLETVAASS